jgi:hypothetical protein
LRQVNWRKRDFLSRKLPVRRRLTRDMRPSESWNLEYPFSLELAPIIFLCTDP